MSSTFRRYHRYQSNGGDDDENEGVADRYHSSSVREDGGAGFRSRYEDDEDDDLMNPRASLLKDDASPPLQWGGMGLQHHAATDQEELSGSRFGIDDIAGGAFAVPVDSNERPPSMFNPASPTTLEALSSSGLSLSKHSGTMNSPTSVSLPSSKPTGATSSVNDNNTGPPKRRKWQSPAKAQANTATASIASTLFSKTLLDDEDDFDRQDSTLNSGNQVSPPMPPGAVAEQLEDKHLSEKEKASGSNNSAGASRSAKDPSGSSRSSSSTTSSPHHAGFSFEALSKSRKGIVSGLTSLKNSIMIPSLHQQSSATSPASTSAAVTTHRSAPGTPRHHDHEGGSRPSLTHSQSSLLDHVVLPASDTYSELLFDAHNHPPDTDDHHRHRHHHTGSRTIRSGAATPDTSNGELGAGAGKKERWGSSSVQTKWSFVTGGAGTSSGYHSHQHSRTHSPWTSPSSSTVFLPPRPLQSTKGGNSGSGRGGGTRNQHHHGPETNPGLQAASQRLGAVETEFQRVLQHQSQLLLRKADLGKELVSLYSRRNQCQRKQSQAAAEEQFEEAEELRTRAQTILERVATVESLLAETERRLWELGKRQMELGKSVAQAQMQLVQEMAAWQQQRQDRMKLFQQQQEQQREQEMGRISAERERLEQERSNVALGVDFLGKNEQELKDRVEEETRAEQKQLREVLDARSKIKDEIEELEKRLSQLRAQDVQLDEDESRLRQKIREMTVQFDKQAKELRQERAHLDDRISDMNQKAQQLDHSEAEIQAWKQRSQRAQNEMEHEIQSLHEQQVRLANVHAHFEHEMEAIKALFSEEESFREMKARWAMRASSLAEDLNKHEQLCRTLATKLLEEQKQLRDLEHGIEKLEAQIPKLESSKSLAVQQRDFKLAASFANEISTTKEAILSKQKELEARRQAENEQEQGRLAQLNEEYERLKLFVQEEEAKLAKEIEVEAKNFSEQLEAKEDSMTSFTVRDTASLKDEDRGSATPNNTESTDDKEPKEGGEVPATATDVPSKNPQLLLFKSLFKGRLSDLEMVRQLAKVRFGREEASLQPQSTAAIEQGAALRNDDSSVENNRDNSKDHKQDEKDRIERDIQAAIAEEDYERAAELQTQLDGLGGAA